MQLDRPLPHTLKADFQYSHKNPYHEKLKEYDSFVLRDRECEYFPGKWGEEIFKNKNPIAVEIGPGYGHFMLEYCGRHPSLNFVGIDARFKRSFQLVKKIARNNLFNVRYLRARGERLHFIFGAEEVDRVFFFFPDPWSKNKHRKKRLLRPSFLDSVYRILRPGGEFFIKTDHDDYAAHMAFYLKRDQRWSMALETNNLHADYPDHFLSTYLTKFEKIFLSQRVPVKAFVLQKI